MKNNREARVNLKVWKVLILYQKRMIIIWIIVFIYYPKNLILRDKLIKNQKLNLNHNIKYEK
jgi:hypothetical protein